MAKAKKEKATDTLFKFPCTFPIKVMGDADQDIEKLVKQTLQEHVNAKRSIKIQSKLSSNETYISVTGTFTAESKDQLDTIYKILSKHKSVKMVL